ncbi:MAG TPA: transferrin receptor-like dimerization domain-containing protein [Thermoanaerobaculia bacterium]|jgi:N-acetylated-alpha-linked acidic dipeptidase|nr:transferrin receptor-like dimerization domain-containing protein [Thermoanaerobaculia bacterium]
MLGRLGRRRLVIPVLALALASQAAAAPVPSSEPLLGFSNDRASDERALEARFDAALNAANLRQWLQRLSAHPHHVGSPWDKSNAEFMAGLFRSWGYQTQIEQFKVLFPTPKVRLLEMEAPTRFKASLAEPALPEDSTSGQAAEQLPLYNAYSIDGDVTGELVYVNFGVPKDYEELQRRGIDVKGKIVIARYYGSWRGIKPKVAAEHGAIGCIIYSDPHEDGYFQGDVYPKGGYRSDQSGQRGSVADMPLYSGDPLTPGVGATEDAKRLDVKSAPTITKIPVLPISYGDALPLLKALGGPIAPEAWRGSLPIPYHLGAGPARVHLKLEFNWNLSPVYDVIARFPGAERPDEWIVRGNHHDGWVNGAMDPLSGMVSELEEARGVGELAKAGWKPKRTIVYAAWDGEEPGLLGSTEWAETHAAELRDHAVVYVNSDSNSRGFFGAGGSHTLETFVSQVIRDVPDPEKGVSVLDRALAANVLFGPPDQQQEAREARASRTLHLEALGSGSDFTPFLQHLGISALNIGYGGEEQYGQYHSIYDSFDHFTRFGDPKFEYGVALAKTGGRLTLRLADADVLPLTFDPFAAAVGKYVDEVVKLTDTLRQEAEERNRRLDDKLFQSVDDPTQTWVAPPRLDPAPYLNFAPLQNAVAALKQSTAAYDKAWAAATAGGRALPAETANRLNEILMKSERALTRPEGLPRRSWYVHQIYAPGFYTGYGVKTLPAVREALEQRNWKEATDEIPLVAATIESFAKEIDRATAVLGTK